MSTYEEFMVILTAALLIVSILDMKNQNHWLSRWFALAYKGLLPAKPKGLLIKTPRLQ